MGSLTWDKEIQGFSATGFESGAEGSDDHPWGEDWMEKVIAAQWGETGLLWYGGSDGGIATSDSKLNIGSQIAGGNFGPSAWENISAGMWCRTSADPVNGQPLWLLGGAKADSGISGITPPQIGVSTDGGMNVEYANLPSFGAFVFNDGTPNPTANVDGFSYDLSSGTMYARVMGGSIFLRVYYVISSGDGANWNIASGPIYIPTGFFVTPTQAMPGVITMPPTPASNKLVRLGFPYYPYALGTLKSTTPGKSGGTYLATLTNSSATSSNSGVVQFTNIKDGSSFSTTAGQFVAVSFIVWTAGKFIVGGETGTGDPSTIIPGAVYWTDDGKNWNQVSVLSSTPFDSVVGIAAGPKGLQHP